MAKINLPGGFRIRASPLSIRTLYDSVALFSTLECLNIFDNSVDKALAGFD